MMASAFRQRRSRVRAPPPTPIRTGKGNRSAAVDDKVLAEFLDKSMKVPDLNLPRTHFPSPHLPSPIADEINVCSLDEGDIVAESRVVKAVRETGAFRISASSLSVDEVKQAIEAAKMAFSISDQTKEKTLSNLFRRRDVVEEEFYWTSPLNPQTSLSLQSSFLSPQSYQSFKLALDSISSKLDKLSRSISTSLQSNAKSPTAQMTKTPLSLLCITQFSVNQSSLTWDQLGDADQPSNYSLCLHVAPQNQDFRIRCPDGSNFIEIPCGSALVTAGKQLQDWSKGEYKSAIGEVLYELSEDPNPFYSLEFFYDVQEEITGADTGLIKLDNNTVSIKQQVLILAFIFTFCNSVSFWLGSIFA
ncbi:hypothetical protein LUZ60_011024 [Juncus effusus]|nr:hypothetical protein LUZ60_011024 [Juncus effusus]